MKTKMKKNLQSQKLDKNNISEKILVTIITVVFNDKENLEKTIFSVANQKFKNFEYIVIDGGSTDGSLEIIQKYNHLIDHWVSEKDEGIYDAMNKGLSLAKGSWVNFMNCGDSFHDSSVLQNVKFDQLTNYTIIYGSAKIFNKKNKFLKILKPLKLNLRNLIFFGTRIVCHQAVFYNNHFKFRFPKKYKLKGELYSYFEYLKYGKVKNLDMIICNYKLGGIGSINYKKNRRELWDVLKYQVGIYRFFFIPFLIYRMIFK